MLVEVGPVFAEADLAFKVEHDIRQVEEDEHPQYIDVIGASIKDTAWAFVQVKAGAEEGSHDEEGGEPDFQVNAYFEAD